MVRNYRPNDYSVISEWFLKSGSVSPGPEHIPLGSSFIYEDPVLGPILFVVLLMTNSAISYIEFFVGNPSCSGHNRRQGTKILLNHLKETARRWGCKRLVCFSPNEKLRKYYNDLGLQETITGLTAHGMEV
jgi:GNAT superfamily N-acetyltransferase